MARNPLIRKTPTMTGPSKVGHKSAGILDDFAIRKNVATKEGTIEKVPVNDSDIVNKKYVNDEIAAIPAATLQSATTAGNTTTTNIAMGKELTLTAPTGEPEIYMIGVNRGIKLEMDDAASNDDFDIYGQTAAVNTEVSVHSMDGQSASLRLYSGNTNYTNIAVNSDDHFKILNNVEDKNITLQVNDGGVNKQVIVCYGATGTATLTDGSNLATDAAPINDVDIVNKKYVDDNDTDTTYLGGTNLTLAGTTFNVDDAFLKNDAADIGVGLQLTQDNSSADTQFTPQVLYNTDATPPAASGFPIGTIYIQYTA